MPNLYCFDAQGVFTGVQEAKLDAKESRKQGQDVWLRPANSVWEPVPEITLEAPNKYYWSGLVWESIADYRGQIIYQQVEPYAAKIMEDVGPIPAGYALTPPVIEE